MRGFLASLRTGDWLTRERMVLIAGGVLIASLIGLAALIATSNGTLDRRGHPIGTDFSNVYAAGTYVLEGRPDAPFDPVLQHARERDIFGTNVPFYGWHYPPFFLFVAAVLALLPYGLALAVWQLTTFLLYLWSIRAILSLREQAPNLPAGEKSVDPLWLLCAAAFPAVLVNVGHGHNGFLTAALIGGALVLLDRRPALAGVLFGLLSYKPQFGLMIPLMLVATGRWRTFGFAALTVAALAIATTITFGPQVWSAFLASTEFSRVVVLEAGNTGWHKIQSVFSWARMWGGSIGLAYALHATVVRRPGCRAGSAVAQRPPLPAQGRCTDHRINAVDTLRARLRHDGLGARHRVSGGRRIAARIWPRTKDSTGAALDGASCRTQHRRFYPAAGRRVGDGRSADSLHALGRHRSVINARCAAGQNKLAGNIDKE